MRSSRLRFRWICATIAPWALAGGVIVSFTASAGYPPFAHSVIGLQKPLAPREIAANEAGPLLDGRVRLASLSADWMLAQRAPSVDLARRGAALGADIDPSPEMKVSAHGFPEVDRRLKGDPLLSLRPGMSRVKPVDPARELDEIIFGLDEDNLVLGVFQPSASESMGFAGRFDSARRWTPPRAATRDASSEASPQAAASTPTQTAGDGGATPSVARNIALASITPAPADSVPVAVAAAPVSAPGVTSIARDSMRPRYVDLVPAAALPHEMKCLSEAVYFEARSESEDGQAAVAQVVLNRVRSGLYPSTICGVVYQNRNRYLGCQFTFACEGKSLAITEPEPWRVATRIARAVFDGRQYNDDVGGATHYHARYVRPYWAKRLQRMDVIGQHVFYRLRPGQT